MICSIPVHPANMLGIICVVPSSKVILFSWSQPLNLPDVSFQFSVLFRLLGISISVSAWHSSNAPFPNSSRFFDNVTDARLMQYENALDPIVITLSGIVILCRFSHRENAATPMSVMVSGIVIRSIPGQPQNSPYGIFVIPCSNVML